MRTKAEMIEDAKNDLSEASRQHFLTSKALDRIAEAMEDLHRDRFKRFDDLDLEEHRIRLAAEELAELGETEALENVESRFGPRED